MAGGTDWSKRHPVVRLDFAGGSCKAADGLAASIAAHIPGGGTRAPSGCRVQYAAGTLLALDPAAPRTRQSLGSSADRRIRQADPRQEGNEKWPTGLPAGVSEGAVFCLERLTVWRERRLERSSRRQWQSAGAAAPPREHPLPNGRDQDHPALAHRMPLSVRGAKLPSTSIAILNANSVLGSLPEAGGDRERRRDNDNTRGRGRDIVTIADVAPGDNAATTS